MEVREDTRTMGAIKGGGMITMEPYYRHGDLLLTRVDSIPTKAQKTVTNILQEGEVTGHKHRLRGQSQIYELEDQKYVQVEEPTELMHEDHDTIVLERGTYVLEHERELDIVGEVRRVQD